MPIAIPIQIIFFAPNSHEEVGSLTYPSLLSSVEDNSDDSYNILLPPSTRSGPGASTKKRMRTTEEIYEEVEHTPKAYVSLWALQKSGILKTSL
jgi:hypothetical protein